MSLLYRMEGRFKNYENRARNGKQNLWTISERGKDNCFSPSTITQNNKNLFLIFLEAEKSKIKAPADSVLATAFKT